MIFGNKNNWLILFDNWRTLQGVFSLQDDFQSFYPLHFWIFSSFPRKLPKFPATTRTIRSAKTENFHPDVRDSVLYVHGVIVTQNKVFTRVGKLLNER